MKDAQDQSEDDPKVAAILRAAFEAFRTYGYRRTSMEDIAAGVGMSRSALYLHFRNKEGIFRSLVARHYDDNARAMAEVLCPGMPAGSALAAALAAKDGQVIEAILASPHGAELMDTGFATSTDLAQAGEARFAEILGNWLETEAKANRVLLGPEMGSAQDVAAMVLVAAKGLKYTGQDPETYREMRDRFAEVLARGLAADPDQS